MPTVKVPFNGEYTNISQEQLVDESYEIYDCYIDEKGGLHRRPGLSLIHDFNENAQIDGVYWWSAKEYAIVVTNGKTFKVENFSGVFVVTNLTGVSLAVGKRVSFADDGTNVYMANGGQIIYTDGTAATAAIADGDAPTNVTHVAWLDSYLIANNSDDSFYFSEVADSLTWTASDFASSVSKPDKLTALMINNRELYNFGPISTEIWENNGRTPFERIPQGALQTGCIAPYSIIYTEKGIYWLSDKRRFVRFDGRSVEVMSTPNDKTFDELSVVNDCLADHVVINGQSLTILTFPTANKTIVYNHTSETWSRWGAWDGADSYDRFVGNAYAYAPSWGMHIIGDRRDSFLHIMSSDYYTDAGNVVRAHIKTGHIDDGTSQKKRIRELRFRAKRGVGLGTRTPKLAMRYRFDNKPNWSSEKQLSLGDLGDTNLLIKTTPRGNYRTVQFEFTLTDEVPLVISEVEKDIDILR